ncbi:isoleucine--tRNA ligase [Sphingomonas mesophila]|uniref:isoleucine--tRNA ligase n=1 Tax=Sphingomonas mesophila TaxID=2303576 RepID=UPI000E578037|nr:isoleucine--tRNA ligase [Sphingomonas mesophila]
MSEKPDYRATVFLPKTDFPMKAGLPQKEPAILARWEADGLYRQLRAARSGREKFILHDGPPYANGDIHIGHALNKTLKDMVVRTQSLLGKDAPYVPGWDCHGLPIEWKIEEQYRKKKLNKDEVPASEFRAECRAYAAHWVGVQREQFKRLGIGGAWDKPYLTMDFNAEATIVAELMKFAESGQLYRGAKPVMWSPVEKTALAEAEIEYEDITSTQIDVAFEIIESPIEELVGAHAVVWTTTPWTIPVNQAIAYGPEIEYSLVGVSKKRRLGDQTFELAQDFPTMQPESIFLGNFLIASELIPVLAKRAALPDGPGLFIQKPVITITGSNLAGTIARHPMHRLGGFFAAPRPFLPGEFVTTDSGTGLVHMAPDHGEDDFELCKANGIGPVFAVEGDGKYRADWAWLGGQGSVINPKFNAPDGPICSDLRDAGALLAASVDYQHSYPHSWRSKAKVIYRCTPQWFVAMDRALAADRFTRSAKSRWENEGGALPLPLAGGEEPRRGEGAGPPPAPPVSGRGGTLRHLALNAIAATRFVPDKGRNRIGSMVEGRPDWVLSRQRAWGVPIALFVDRKTGEPLVDTEVNASIVAAVRAEGVDAWDEANAAAFLGPERDPADYEMVRDILDVWFDSGCTHAFVLESGEWPDLAWPADLYLEGSDQHRGWFQSSLLQSCGTRGRAPYKAVLTHGFTMDSKGMKMSKSLGNTVDPLKVMETYGADIIRLWALSVDYTEDHRIGDEILKGVADQYRKLRNTFRYLLGALDGFGEEERVAVAEMPELERYMLGLLGQLDQRLRAATEAFDFNDYTRALADFCNEDLSAFYFDIRKDCLYCDIGPALPGGTLKRRAYRTVLDTLFHALVRYAAPVLVFTAEEVWGTRYPDGGSVHLLEWPDVAGRPDAFDGAPSAGLDPSLRWDDEQWGALRALRTQVTEAIEPLRRDKVIGSSLEAEVAAPGEADPALLAELFITSTVRRGEAIAVSKTDNHKCGRCWRHLPEVAEDGALCGRCEEMVHG